MTFVFDFRLRDRKGARPTVRDIAAAYHARAGAAAGGMLPPPPPFGDGSSVGTVTLGVGGVSSISSKAAHRSAIANACRAAVDNVCEAARSRGEELTDEEISLRAGVGLENVKGVWRFYKGAAEGGEWRGGCRARAGPNTCQRAAGRSDSRERAAAPPWPACLGARQLLLLLLLWLLLLLLWQALTPSASSPPLTRVAPLPPQATCARTSRA